MWAETIVLNRVTLENGVSQGSVLSPLPFSVYTHDLNKIIQSHYMSSHTNIHQ